MISATSSLTVSLLVGGESRGNGSVGASHCLGGCGRAGGEVPRLASVSGLGLPFATGAWRGWGTACSRAAAGAGDAGGSGKTVRSGDVTGGPDAACAADTVRSPEAASSAAARSRSSAIALNRCCRTDSGSTDDPTLAGGFGESAEPGTRRGSGGVPLSFVMPPTPRAHAQDEACSWTAQHTVSRHSTEIAHCHTDNYPMYASLGRGAIATVAHVRERVSVSVDTPRRNAASATGLPSMRQSW